MAADRQPSIEVDGYQRFVRIGAGGFSSVYRAEQNTLGREVAVKVLHTELDSEQERLTFERECRALGLLSRHPNIVTVYHDAVAADGRRCIVMELYRGTIREQLATGGKRPVAEVLRLGIKIGSALQVAHDAGVLHRDVKPHNILLSEYGEPALSDFGISVIDVERSVSAASGLSLAYASPEAIDGRRATRASDIYSLGATLFHLLEGEPPFAAPRLEATLAKIMTAPAPALTRDDVPASLSAILQDCLAKSPADRPAGAEDLVAALREVETELGLDRTLIPEQHDQRSLLAHESESPTVGQPGDAVAAAFRSPGSVNEVAGLDGSESDEVVARSRPSLWPPGWSPWISEGDDGAGEDTIVRPQRKGQRRAQPTPGPVVVDEHPGRRPSPMVLSAVALAIAVAVIAVLLLS